MPGPASSFLVYTSLALVHWLPSAVYCWITVLRVGTSAALLSTFICTYLHVYLLLVMCVHCVCGDGARKCMCMWNPEESTRSPASPRPGVTGSCQETDVGARNQTQAICKNSKGSPLLSHLSSQARSGLIKSHKLGILGEAWNLRPFTVQDKRNGITFFTFRVMFAARLLQMLWIRLGDLLPIISLPGLLWRLNFVCSLIQQFVCLCWCCGYFPPPFCFLCELYWLVFCVRTIWQHQSSP